MIIGHFVFRRRWLSNNYNCRVVYKDNEYKSVEHAYQAQKATTKYNHDWVAAAAGAAEARRRGRSLPKVRTGFHSFKRRLMLKLLWSKFHHNPRLREKLLATFPHELVNGNVQGDTYWGVDRATGKGDNLLGKHLMFLRDCIRAGTDHRIPLMGVKKLEQHKRYRQNVRDRYNEPNLGIVVRPLPRLTYDQELKMPYRAARRLRRVGNQQMSELLSHLTPKMQADRKEQAQLRLEAYGVVEKLDPNRPGTKKWPKKEWGDEYQRRRKG